MESWFENMFLKRVSLSLSSSVSFRAISCARYFVLNNESESENNKMLIMSPLAKTIITLLFIGEI